MAITNIESSSVQLRRHTGSAGVAPPTDIMLEGEFAVNLIDGHLYYGGLEGNSISSSFTFTDLLVTHSTQLSGSLDIEVENTNITGNLLIEGNISASGVFTGSDVLIDGDLTVIGTGSFDVLITNYESSSIIYASGSTKFGDTSDDTHEFTGSVFISGSEFNIDNDFFYKPDSYSLFSSGSITASYDISASNTIYASDLDIANNVSISGDLEVRNITSSGYISASNTIYSKNFEVVQDITASNNISASNTIYTNNLEVATDVSVSGDISASGFLYDAGVTTPSLYVAGDISSSANISASGMLTVNNITATGNITASGDISSSANIIAAGEGIFASAKIEDLTDNRIVIVGSGGELEDDANFTFNGTELNIGNGNFTIQQGSGNTQIVGTLDVDDQSTLSSVNVQDLTSGRVVLAGTSGEIEDSANLTFDGNKLNVNASLFVGNSITASSDISASGNIYASAISASGGISASGDLLVNNITASGNISESGYISSSGAVFDGDITVIGTGSFDVLVTNYSASTIYASGSTKFGDTSDDTHIRTGSMFISGGLFVNNSITASSNISASNLFITNISSSGYISASNYVLTNNITASNNISASQTIYGNNLEITQDITASNNISASGHISSSLLNVGSAAVTDLTNNRVVIVGTNGELEDDTNFTFDGNELNVKKSVFVENSITASTDISASNTISASRLYASTQGTFESANVKDLTSTRIVFAGTDGELQDSANLTFDGNEVTIDGNLDVQSITSSIAISGSHISSSGMDIVGDVTVVGTLSASAFEGILQTQYTTKSEEFEPGGPIHNLATYRVVNFMPDIFITSSGTELIIQFGEPLIPTNLIGNLNGFNTNRFSGPGPVSPPTSTYVYDNYNVSFTYTLDASNTFLSASLLSMSAGTVIEISSSADGDGSTTNDGLDYTTTFYIDKDNTGYSGGVTSGSQKFTASVHVTLQDESKQSFNFVDTGNDLVGTISKGGPGNTRVSYNYNNMNNNTTYVSNNSSTNTSNKVIEEGETGTFTYKAVVASSLNGWNNTSLTPSSNTTVTVTATNTHTLDHEANYDSDGLGSPTNFSGNPKTTTNSFTRTQSLRYGISPTTQTGSGGFTEGELQNLDGWIGGVAIEDGQIDFISNATSNNYTISNDTISMTSTVPGFIYIAYRATHADLTEIRQGATDVTSTFSLSTVGNYKVYKSNSVQAAGTFTFILNP